MNSSPTDKSTRTLKISRVVNAPRALVFEVWTNPEHIKKWWGPEGFTSTIKTMEVYANGEWDFVMHGPDGTNYKNKSVYREVVAPEKIVFDHITGPKFRTTVLFTALGKQTRIDMEMLFETSEELASAIRTFGADEGLKQTIGRLEGYLQQDTAEREISITRQLKAPRELVFKVWTDPNHIAKWWGPNGFTNTIHSMDVKPGGTWRFMMHGADGTDFPNFVRYHEVVPNERLAYSHGRDEAMDAGHFEVTVTFTSLGTSITEITMRMVFVSKEERNRVVEKFGAIEGNRQTIARLEKYLSELI